MDLDGRPHGLLPLSFSPPGSLPCGLSSSGANSQRLIPTYLDDGAVKIVRQKANPNVVKVTYDTDPTDPSNDMVLDLPLVAGGTEASLTKKHECVPEPGKEPEPVFFQCEVFQRIAPPDTNPPPAATPADSGPLKFRAIPNTRLKFCQPTVMIAWGRQFMNGGFASSVITRFEIKISRATSAWKKGVVITPKASTSPEGAKALPRYDGKTKYPAQWLLKNPANEKQQLGVIMYDNPGTTNWKVSTAAEETKVAGQPLELDDKVEWFISFSTFFFTDCNLKPEKDSTTDSAELLTHRVDWTFEVQISAVKGGAPLTQGHVVVPAKPTVAPDPELGVWEQAAKNDPPRDGWAVSKDTVVVTPF